MEAKFLVREIKVDDWNEEEGGSDPILYSIDITFMNTLCYKEEEVPSISQLIEQWVSYWDSLNFLFPRTPIHPKKPDVWKEK